MRRTVLPLAVVLALTLAAPAAGAVERVAAPDSAMTAGPCDAPNPCRLDFAVSGADPGDTVTLEPGEYTTGATVAANVAITLRGRPGAVHPRVRGTGPGPTVALNAGGQVQHLAIGAAGVDATALRITGGLVEDVAAVGEAGAGLHVTGAGTPTIVRDTVVVAAAPTDAVAALRLDGTGAILLRNLTVWGRAAAEGVRCSVTGAGTASLRNVLVRAAVTDIDATVGGAGRCSADSSNFRPVASQGIGVASSTNQVAEPLLVDAAAGDFRPRAGSPTIDAGTSDAYLGTNDPDGRPRTLGRAPDVGAYETAAPEPVAGPGPLATFPAPATAVPRAETGTAGTGAPPAPPKLGRSVVLDVATGTVKVRRPGARTYVPLADAANLPVGTVIDTTDGAVTLQTALPGGRRQTGTFSGGRFIVRQPSRDRGYTDLVLTGGSRAGCPRARRTAARAAARRKPVRRLWGRDSGGRFRTHGQNSVAIVRGTRWLTEDRCAGTYTRVTQGAVDVRSKRTGRTRRIRAGRSILVR